MTDFNSSTAFHFLQDQLYTSAEDLQKAFPHAHDVLGLVSTISEAVHSGNGDLPSPTTVYLALSDKDKYQLTAVLSLTDCHTPRGLMSFISASRYKAEGEWETLRQDLYTEENKENDQPYDSSLAGRTLEQLTAEMMSARYESSKSWVKGESDLHHNQLQDADKEVVMFLGGAAAPPYASKLVRAVSSKAEKDGKDPSWKGASECLRQAS